MTKLQQAVFDAALFLTDETREAKKVFSSGFEKMPALVRSSQAAKDMAGRVAAAGKRFEQAVDDYRRYS